MLRYRFLYSLLFVVTLFFSSNVHAADKKAPDFKLSNWDGKTLSMKDLKGRKVVLAFSYAYCSATCPIITGRLFFFDQEINSPKDVVYLHISMDPEKDSELIRKDYFTRHGIDLDKDKRWVFLSGKRATLEKVWNSYGISVEKVIDKKLPEGYYMRFTPRVLIIDKNGNIRHETDFNFSEDDLKEALRRI